MTEWLLWSWRYQALTVMRCDSLDDAVSLAREDAEYGRTAFECIEGPDGVVDGALVREIWDRLDKEEEEEDEAEAGPRATHVLWLEPPSGKEDFVPYRFFYSAEDAEAALAEARQSYGDRVELRVLTREREEWAS